MSSCVSDQKEPEFKQPFIAIGFKYPRAKIIEAINFLLTIGQICLEIRFCVIMYEIDHQIIGEPECPNITGAPETRPPVSASYTPCNNFINRYVILPYQHILTNIYF